MKTLSHGFDLLRRLAFVLLFMGIAGHAMATKAYSDNGDGTVTDPTTGLVWMRCAMGQVWDGTTCTWSGITYAWDQANAIAGKVTFAGNSDWRLPNIRELQTIVDRSVSNPAIDAVAFPGTSASSFWSASAVAGNSYGAWYVDFFYGGAYYNGKSDAFQVRLVRAGQSLNLLDIARPDSDYVDQGDGSVKHAPTGLIWQRCAVGQSWTGSTCSGTASSLTMDTAMVLTSSVAGQTDWRLPSEEELLSLVDYSKKTEGRYRFPLPLINSSLFPNTPNSKFWSATAYDANSVLTWDVDFGSGEASITASGASITGTRYANLVRLVRAGTAATTTTQAATGQTLTLPIG